MKMASTAKATKSSTVITSTQSSKPQNPTNTSNTLSTTKKPYICFICSEAFDSLRVWNAHISIHYSKTTFQCNFCVQVKPWEKDASKLLVSYRQFDNRFHLINHLKDEHKINRCAFCGETWHNEPDKYNDHVLDHYKSKDLEKCDVCDLVVSKGHYDKHFEIHVGYFQSQRKVGRIFFHSWI